MDFDFYLSEMSVSNLHGGGLTLQRVIGEDLMKIPYFMHVSRFAADVPAADKFLGRCENLTTFWERDWVRLMIGRSRASALNNNLFFVKRYAKNASKKIARKFDKKQVWALVCPQSPFSIYTLEELKRYKEVKYITWIMDDHMVGFSNGAWQYPKGTEETMRKHLVSAEHVFVISPAMQDFYKRRFGINSTVIFGPADILADSGPAIFNTTLPLKIGYFGAVAAWQLDVLQLLARAIKGTDVQLDIYSGISQLPSGLFLENINLKGMLSPGEVLPAMKKYGTLLLPVSFLEKMRNMSEFNIATKMSEYLASGVPVLAVGPQYAAMIQYLQMNNAAVVVDSEREDEIKSAFKLFTNQQYIEQILANAAYLAINYTGTLPMRKKWMEVVNK
jgi:hypothetical protein